MIEPQTKHHKHYKKVKAGKIIEVYDDGNEGTTNNPTSYLSQCSWQQAYAQVIA